MSERIRHLMGDASGTSSADRDRIFSPCSGALTESIRRLSHLCRFVWLNHTGDRFGPLARFVWAGANVAIALGCPPKADRTSEPDLLEEVVSVRCQMYSGAGWFVVRT